MIASRLCVTTRPKLDVRVVPSEKMPEKCAQQSEEQSHEKANRIDHCLCIHKLNPNGFTGKLPVIVQRLSKLGPFVTYKKAANL